MVMPIDAPDYQGFTLPEVIDPPSSRCFLVRVPDDPAHVAAFLGVLFDLTQWLNWQRDSLKRGKDAAAVWRKIWVDLAAQSCIVPPAFSGQEVEDFMPLRVDCNCNVFITCCDGTEKQILTGDQVKALIAGGSVQGAPQPKPGACVELTGTISNGNRFLVPIPVSTGDTISVDGVLGASLDTANAFWLCTSGLTFLAGACVGSVAHDATNLVPAAPSGSIIMLLNGAYYPLTDVPFTIPSGVSNQQPQLLLNYPLGATIYGDVGFFVHVCNNQSSVWTHTLDFALAPGPFEPTTTGGTPDATWIAGSGWSWTEKTGLPQTIRVVSGTITLPARTLTNYEIVYDFTNGPGDGNPNVPLQEVFTNIGTVFQDLGGSGPTGTNIDRAFASIQVGVTSIAIELEPCDTFGASSGTALLRKLILTGQGTDPF